jgi:hypothetical protein
MKLAGDPTNPVRFKEDATADELREMRFFTWALSPLAISRSLVTSVPSISFATMSSTLSVDGTITVLSLCTSSRGGVPGFERLGGSAIFGSPPLKMDWCPEARAHVKPILARPRALGKRCFVQWLALLGCVD